MAGRMDGKRALVTAAAQGIGNATARAFAAEGAMVHATDVNEAGLASLADVAGIETTRLDVTRQAEVDAVVGAIGPVDVLFNCAGFVHHGTVLESTEAEWDFGFELNVKSMYRMTRACLPGMIEMGGGSIINMASVSSSIKGIVNRCIYGASKAAVIGLTKSVAADYVTAGVRVNAICPGTVQSPSLDDRIAALGDAVEGRKAFVARQPMGRLGSAEEIAALAVYLASDESAFTTGTTLVVDGGIVI